MKTQEHDVVYTLSDLHLGEGGMMEDFHRDEEFAGLISHILAAEPQDAHLRLQLLGDVFDPLAVALDGVYDVPPYEYHCMRQMQRIMAEHPVFFDALRCFLADPRTEIFFFIGNHDFFIEWDAVQEALQRRIAGKHSHRIRFVYEELHGGVYYHHGNFEPNNAIDMTERYILPTTHTRTREVLLNYPYGSYLAAQTLPRLRALHPYVGRLKYHGYFFKEAATRHWRLGIYALWLYVTNFFHNRLFAFWDVRRKTSLVMTGKILLWTLFGTPQERESEELIARQPKIQAVVCGHDHHAREVAIMGGRFFNTGTWSRVYDIVWHDEPRAPWGIKVLTQVAEFVSHVWHRPEYVLIERLPVVVARHSEGEFVIGLYDWKLSEKRLDSWYPAGHNDGR